MGRRLTHWQPHSHAGVEYFNTHLHPFAFTLRLEKTEKYPAADIQVRVGFSAHCFTRTPRPEDLPEHRYAGLRREDRTFCLERHALSQHLPNIVRGLPSKMCFYAGQENYLTVELPDALPAGQEYWVFFDVRSLGQPDAVLVFVQSAYPTDGRTTPRGRRRKRVGFKVLVNLALRGKRPQQPP